MSEVITRFFDQPALNQLHPGYDQKIVFLIEAAHAAAAWGVFMHGRVQPASEQLWFGTPHQAHMLQGPTWFVGDSRSIEPLAEICHQQPAGIALRCTDPKIALAHARTLLSKGVRDIHDPAVWAALAMESGPQRACLFGPWSEVYSPVPRADAKSRQWHVWRNDVSVTGLCEYPLPLPDSLYSTYTDIRWLHWLRQNPQQFSQLRDEELPRVVGNLDFLVKHGIGVDRDLLQLSPLITYGDLRQRDDLLPVLTSRERPHRRVEQLLQGLQP